MSDEIRGALDPVADALEELEITYRIGGSVARSALGIARSTLDVDLVADLREEHVAAFVSRLQASYYVDADMRALDRGGERSGRARTTPPRRTLGGEGSEERIGVAVGVDGAIF